MPPSTTPSLPTLLLLSLTLHTLLILYAHHTDSTSPLKYTDIDYYVFTDASTFLSRSLSPYTRSTYRYTPLLAWLLYPTTFGGPAWFAFGKCVFAAADLGAGWVMYRILTTPPTMSESSSSPGVKSRGGKGGGGGGGLGMEKARARRYVAVCWLLNPMVMAISTRGSSEGLLGFFVMGLLWAVVERRWVVAGGLLGWGVHWKIYPVVYAGAVVWWMGKDREEEKVEGDWLKRLWGFFTKERMVFAASGLAVFMGLNAVMYAVYGYPFLHETYLYHLIRIDHRHNFSPYNTLLYLNSSPKPSLLATTTTPPPSLELERLAFLPQLLLSAVLIPLALAKKDLPSTLLAQTFAFVTFNKVCTSQYFIWYTIFLPFYLPSSTLVKSPRIGVAALVLWVLGQATWLQQAFELEFNGKSTFVPGLWVSSILFFIVNVGILGIIIDDVKKRPECASSVEQAKVEGTKSM